MSEEKESLDVTTFSIGDKQYPFELATDVKIDKQNLNGEFQDHSEIFAFYATAYELALDMESRAKAHLDRVYAQEDYQARMNGQQAGVKLTEKMVENTAITQQSYVDALEQYMEAKKNVGLLRAAKDALIHKRDMLISLGAMMRAEGMSDISIKQEAVKSIMKGPKVA